MLRNGDRVCYHTGGDPSGMPELRGITAPTLVIRGDRDLMVHPSGDRATAATIPGARHLTITGMGHDLAPVAIGTLAGLIVSHARDSA